MEIFYNGNWGTVCDDYWDMNDARVVCRQLGFTYAVSAPHAARFGAGSGQVWLDNVGCSGSESTIVNCQHRGWGVEDCSHSDDASVVCSSKSCPPAGFNYYFNFTVSKYIFIRRAYINYNLGIAYEFTNASEETINDCKIN